MDPLIGSFIIQILLGLVFGFLIGAEREMRGKTAGISTHTFVICGAMLFTVLDVTYFFESTGRIIAQIVTGIGFLGAGMIIKEKGSIIRNLTTAASIWFSAAIGVAIGLGYFWIAGISTLVCIIIPRIPHFRYHQMKEKNM